MPRKGMGQKIQTAKGQEYGKATHQEEAQRVAPLPELAPPPRPQRREPVRQATPPGAAGDPFRSSERPNEPVTMPVTQTAESQIQLSPERAQSIPPVLHMLYSMANSAYADPALQDFVRRMENFTPTKYDPPR